MCADTVSLQLCPDRRLWLYRYAYTSCRFGWCFVSSLTALSVSFLNLALVSNPGEVQSGLLDPLLHTHSVMNSGRSKFLVLVFLCFKYSRSALTGQKSFPGIAGMTTQAPTSSCYLQALSSSVTCVIFPSSFLLNTTSDLSRLMSRS